MNLLNNNDMTHNCSICINHEDGELEFNVTLVYHIENDGIGSYEFWGAPGYDKGVYFAVIDNIVPQFSKETDHEKEFIKKYIDENFEKCCDYIIEHSEWYKYQH